MSGPKAVSVQERLLNLRGQHAQLSAAEARIVVQLDGVRAQRLRVEGAIELAESLIEAEPAKDPTSRPDRPSPDEPSDPA